MTELPIKTAENGVAADHSAIGQNGFTPIELADCLAQGANPIIEFLKIAIQLASQLSAIHDSGGIHGHINLSKITIDLSTQRVQLINDHPYSQIPQTAPSLFNKDTHLNELFAIAPEQTIFMNCGIDYRIDLYALGIVFYQLLCGRPPFMSQDPSDLIHQHLAKSPLAPNKRRKASPEIVSNLILKLLAKNPEDRYQSAITLQADLEKCLSHVENNENTFHFNLGENDFSKKPQITNKLVGRSQETKQLLDAFEGVKQGDQALILVSGISGIGKTKLIHELQIPIRLASGFYLYGKYNNRDEHIAYQGIIQALRQLVMQILVESEQKLQLWREALLNSLAGNGQIIVDLVPEMELIIGKQPRLKMIDTASVKNRFNRVLTQFLCVFAKKEHPLVLCLDDLHWADTDSLHFITHLLTKNQTAFFLVIGTYHDNEVAREHPLLQCINEIEDSTTTIQPIKLSDLDVDAVNNMLSNTLHAQPKETNTLAKLIFQKTNGHPLLVKKFIQNLLNEHLLTLSTLGKWKWDTDKIVEKRIEPDKMLYQSNLPTIQGLSIKILNLLKLMAAYGKPLTFKVLQRLCQEETHELQKILSKAINKKLLLQHDLYFYFTHDSIQEIIYSLCSTEERKNLHAQIADTLFEKSSAQENEIHLVTIADQFYLGYTITQHKTEKLKLAKLNLAAGNKLKNLAAYSSALTYFRRGIAYLEDIPYWSEDESLALDLHKACAEVALLIGDVETSNQYLQTILKKAKSKLAIAEAYNILVILNTLKADYIQALQIGIKALACLGLTISEDNLHMHSEQAMDVLKNTLCNVQISTLIDNAIIRNSEKKLILKILSDLTAPAFIANRELLVIFSTLMVNLSIEYGNAAESAYGYALYALLAATIHHDYRTAIEFGLLSINLNHPNTNASLSSKSLVIYTNYIHHYSKPIRTVNELNQTLYRISKEMGELQYLGYHYINDLFRKIHQGDDLGTIQPIISEASAFAKATKNQSVLDSISLLNCLLPRLMITTGLADPLLEQTELRLLINCRKNHNPIALCHYFILKAQTCFLFAEYHQAERCISSASKLITVLFSHYAIATCNYLHSLILIALYPNASDNVQQQYLRQLALNQQQMKLWVHHCPENFLHYYQLVEAEVARINLNDLDTIDLYDKAIQSANKNKFPHIAALANELAAKFWLLKGKKPFASLYLNEAVKAYDVWGATKKSEHLIGKYKALISTNRIKNEKDIPPSQEKLLDEPLNQYEMLSLLKATEAISSELDADKLMKRLLKIISEIACASKVAFIAETSQKLYVILESTLNSTRVFPDKPIPLDDWEGGPHSIIYTTKRTNNKIILGNAPKDKTFGVDPYINEKQTKSILCFPITQYDNLKCILYLENALSKNVFTNQRVNTLNLLATHIAISLDNARLYKTLTLAEQHYRKIVAATPVGIFKANPDGRCIYINERGCQILGLNSEQIKGDGWSQALHPDDKIRVINQWHASVQIKAKMKIEYRFVTPKGKIITVLTHTEPEIGENGECNGYIGTLTDITNLREQEIQLRLQNLQLAKIERINRMAEMSSALAHELNQPLSVISLYAQTLLEQSSINKCNPQLCGTVILRKISSEVKRASNVLISIKKLYQSDEPRIVQISIDTLIQRAIQVFNNNYYQALNIELILVKPAPEVLVDDIQVELLLYNLIKNAYEAMQECQSPQSIVKIQTLCCNNEVKIAVTDSGPGIEDSILEFIFEPLYTNKKSGDGVGLAMCRTIAEAHGGNLSVQETSKLGATFQLTLPCVQKKPLHSENSDLTIKEDL